MNAGGTRATEADRLGPCRLRKVWASATGVARAGSILLDVRHAPSATPTDCSHATSLRSAPVHTVARRSTARFRAGEPHAIRAPRAPESRAARQGKEWHDCASLVDGSGDWLRREGPPALHSRPGRRLRTHEQQKSVCNMTELSCFVVDARSRRTLGRALLGRAVGPPKPLAPSVAAPSIAKSWRCPIWLCERDCCNHSAKPWRPRPDRVDHADA